MAGRLLGKGSARRGAAFAAFAAAAFLLAGCARRPVVQPAPVRPEPALDPDALFEAAFSALVLGDHSVAAEGFSGLLARADGPFRRVPDALFWRAYCAELDEDPAGAEQHYAALLELFPDSPYAPLARKRLQDFKADADVGGESIQ